MDVQVISKDSSSFLQQLSLEDLKAELRISHPNEDKKIQDLLNDSLEYFENTTGFFVTKSQVRINLTYRDIFRGYRRSDPSFADAYAPTTHHTYGSYGVFGLQYNDRFEFLVDIGNVRSQRPKTLTVWQDRSDALEKIEFTDEDLALLSDDFIFTLREAPLKFFLNIERDQNEATFRQKGVFNPRVFEFVIESTPPELIPKDILRMIKRMACQLYENPDQDYKGADLIIANVIQRYDCNSGA